MTGWLFAIGSGFAGAVQAGLLARTARGDAGPFSFLLRLMLIAAVLFAAARAGHLPAATAGWFAGYVASVAWLRGRLQ
jgi:hypothetical protein